jgi:hypothetical protein
MNFKIRPADNAALQSYGPASGAGIPTLSGERLLDWARGAAVVKSLA